MIYVLHGPDEYLRSQRLKQLVNTIPEAAQSLNVTRIDGKRFRFDQFAQACEAFPFLHDRRLIIVEDVLKHQRAGKERDALRAYLERLPEWCDVVFFENEDIDKRNAIFTYVNKNGAIEEFAHPKETELIRWIGEQARQRNVAINNQATARLIALVGNNGRTLINELDKLAAYVRIGGSITTDTVNLLVSDDTEENLFAFIDALAARRKGLALGRLRNLINDGQAAQYLIFMIARQVRILIQVRDLDAQRLRPADIASRVGLRPGFITDKAIEQARGFKNGELERLHEQILRLDHQSKTGAIDVNAGLDLLVMEA
jgi:DNA polymerase-3 subunit delta